jgi:hypothetical protein
VVRFPGYISRGPGFDYRRYQIFWEVLGLEQGPLSLMSTTEELHGRNINSSGLENRENVREDALHWPRDTLYLQKLALTTPTCGDRSVGIARLWTKTTEFVSKDTTIKMKASIFWKLFIRRLMDSIFNIFLVFICQWLFWTYKHRTLLP